MQVTRAAKIGAEVVAALGIGLATVVTLLFRGYFDPGLFEIKSTQWSASRQVAMVAERSDHQALNGNVYFVLVEDHVFSPTELRRAYHSADRIFAAGEDCLTTTWEDVNKLVIKCTDSSIGVPDIDVQQHRHGGVDISYVNIPIISHD